MFLNLCLTVGLPRLVHTPIPSLQELNAATLAQSAATTVVTGRVTIEGGSPLPLVDTFRGPTVQFELLASVPGISSRIGSTTMSSDGSFVLPLTAPGGSGEFDVTATMYPLGYHVKSISHGAADLLRSPLRLTPGSNSEIRVVLTTTPPAGTSAGVKVSGRVRNSGNASAAPPVSISVQSLHASANGSRVFRIGSAKVKEDGTFEINGVPPGHYVVRTSPGGVLRSLDVADRDMSALEIVHAVSGLISVLIISDPQPVSSGSLMPILIVAGPVAPLVPPPGSAMLSISQSGTSWGAENMEGALSFFRIERSGDPVREMRLDGIEPFFTLIPGSYELRGYSRGCDGNCNRLGPPMVECVAPISLSAGQVVYAERVLQNNACTIRFNAPPR